jgi:hypothetical protein
MLHFSISANAQYVIIGDITTTTYVDLVPDSCGTYFGNPAFVMDSFDLDLNFDGLLDYKYFAIRQNSIITGPSCNAFIVPLDGNFVSRQAWIVNSNCDSIPDTVYTILNFQSNDTLFGYDSCLASFSHYFHVIQYPPCPFSVGIGTSSAFYIGFQINNVNPPLVGWMKYSITCGCMGGIDSYAYNSLFTSVSVPDIPKYTIAPNPADGYLELRSDEFNFSSVRILDVNGRCVQNKSATGKIARFNTSEINPGVYAVEIRMTDGKTVFRKIVVKH